MVDLNEVRAYYAHIRDDKLRADFAKGASAYQGADVWAIVVDEYRRRGLGRKEAGRPRARYRAHGPEDVLGYYSVLGIPPTATEQAIRQAYRRKAKELHPDRNSAPDAGERFKTLGHAYEILGNPTRRAEYDSKTEPNDRPDVSVHADHPLYSCMRQIDPMPTFTNGFGIGDAMLGRLSVPGLQHHVLVMSWLTLLYIPLIPTGIYLVEHRDSDGAYLFHGEFQFADLRAALGPHSTKQLLGSVFREAGSRFVSVLVPILVILLLARLRLG